MTQEITTADVQQTLPLVPPTEISFIVYGLPQSAGSKRGFPIKRANGTIGVAMTDDNAKSKSWKHEVKAAALASYSGPLIEGPVQLHLCFVRVRPKGHFRSGKNAHLLKDDAPMAPTTKPDVLKLARGVEDALTGVVWHDDAQIVDERLEKVWGDRPCVVVRIAAL